MAKHGKIGSIAIAAAAFTLGFTGFAAAQDGCEGSSPDEASCVDVGGVVIEPADTTTIPDPDVKAETAEPTTSVSGSQTLPVTGSETAGMAAAGAALVGGGGALMAARRRAAVVNR